MSSGSNSARLRIRQASQEHAVEMSASMPTTLRAAPRNRQTFSYFRSFQQARLTLGGPGGHTHDFAEHSQFRLSWSSSQAIVMRS
jgi:hypothetical protein